MVIHWLTTQGNYAPFISRKVVPGMTEGRPSSRVNFSECLYAKIFDLFARAKSWQQRWRMLWLSRVDRDDSVGRAKLFISRKVISTRMINEANHKLVPRVSSFSYPRHIGKREDPGDEVVQITLLVESTFLFLLVHQVWWWKEGKIFMSCVKPQRFIPLVKSICFTSLMQVCWN